MDNLQFYGIRGWAVGCRRFLIGTWLDDWLDTAPWFLIIFGIAGIIAGYRSMFRMVKRVQSDTLTDQNNESESSSRK